MPRPDDRDRLRPVRTADDWTAYHALRRDSLFARLLPDHVYDPAHPDEVAPGRLPHLLRRDGEPIGAIRIDLLDPPRAGLRLIVVRRDLCGRGHGAALVRLAERVAAAHGRSEITINAHPSALGFYLGLGYAAGAWADAGPVPDGLVRVGRRLDAAPVPS